MNWNELRRQTIGASEAAAIMRRSRWAAPLTIWARKRGLLEEEPDNEALKTGRALEPFVVSLFEEQTGKRVVTNPEEMRVIISANCPDATAEVVPDDNGAIRCYVRSKRYPFMSCTPDGIIRDPLAIFEAKTADWWKLKEWSTSIPEDYKLQLLHSLIVTGLRSAYIACLVGNKTLRHDCILYTWCAPEESDEGKALLQAEKEFWEHVENGTEPPADAKDDPLAFHDVEDKVITIDDDTIRDLARQDYAHQEMIAKLENERKAARARIKQRMAQENASVMVIPGAGTYRIRTNSKGHKRLTFEPTEQWAS